MPRAPGVHAIVLAIAVLAGTGCALPADVDINEVIIRPSKQEL